MCYVESVVCENKNRTATKVFCLEKGERKLTSMSRQTVAVRFACYARKFRSWGVRQLSDVMRRKAVVRLADGKKATDLVAAVIA